jgi:hypothetical protein
VDGEGAEEEDYWTQSKGEVVVAVATLEDEEVFCRQSKVGVAVVGMLVEEGEEAFCRQSKVGVVVVVMQVEEDEEVLWLQSKVGGLVVAQETAAEGAEGFWQLYKPVVAAINAARQISMTLGCLWLCC